MTSKPRARWPFCGMPTTKGKSIQTISSLQLCEAKTFQASNEPMLGMSDTRDPTSSPSLNAEQHSVKEIKRSLTMPGKMTYGGLIRQKKISDRSPLTSKCCAERSTVILEHAEKEISTAIEAFPVCPAYELVPKAKVKSKSMPLMTIPKFAPKSLWSPRSFRFRQGGRRRGSFLTKSKVLPRTDEESTLKTEELVGFECIETTSYGNRSVQQRKHTSEASIRSLCPISEEQVERRQSESEREYTFELGERQSCSDSWSPPVEVAMTKLGTKSFASKASKATQHKSVSSRSNSQRQGGLNTFISTFTGKGFSLDLQPSHLSSRCSSSAYDVENDTSTHWTGTASRVTGAYSRASYYSGSYSRSFSASSESSEGEGEEEDEDEEEGCESFSIASNSTLSTRDSVASKVWAATVIFSESLIDAGREDA